MLCPLQEADNWTTLSADVEEVFASQDIHKVTDQGRIQNSKKGGAKVCGVAVSMF